MSQIFLKNISDLKNRDFRFKGVKSEKNLVNNEDSLFKEENSLFSSIFSLFPTIKSKNAFFEDTEFFFRDFFYFFDFFGVDVIKTRGKGKKKQYLVHYRGWPSTYDEWKKESEMKQL